MSAERDSSKNFEPAPGLVIADKVRIERLLARGGMGSVWVGKHLGLDVPVAVKFMANTTDQSVARFRREARVAAKIKSSNIVTILDFGVDRDTPYIVMELLDGENLGARLKRVGHVSLTEAERIIVPIARALEQAHQAHLVHRDLKPDNIFLAREGDEEVPKILDFGIVKSLAGSTSVREETEEGAVLGTPHYMSPEQARGQPDVDHRADIWSLGVILFRMVTGRRPFNGNTFGLVITQICHDPLPKATSILSSLPTELDSFFDRALAKNTADRFSSMKEMAQAFASIARKFGPRNKSVSSRFMQHSTFDSSDAPTLVRAPPPVLPTISTTVEPVTNAKTITRAPVRSGKLAGIALSAVVALAVVFVGILWLMSSTPENDPTLAASITPPIASPSAAIATVTETAPLSPSASSSAMVPTAKPLAGPASKPAVKKTVTSTPKKNRDFGY
jgi:serine/threonine-protein kinase